MSGGERGSTAPRRVVTGVDEDGLSTVIRDDSPFARLIRPGGATITEIWRADSLPAALDEVVPLSVRQVLPVGPHGVAVRICTFPPDAGLDPAAQAAYSAELAQSYGATGSTTPVPGMHRTDTVDIVTVLSGELHLVTETGDAVLRAGDTVVQRGTSHAWSNRTDHPTTVVAVMMSAVAAAFSATPDE